MAKAIYEKQDEEGENEENVKGNKPCKQKRKRLGISCMFNTEVGAALAVIRRPHDLNPQFILPPDNSDSLVSNSLKSLRALLFNPQQEWHTMDPSVYLGPFLDVHQSEDILASATVAALSAILKILTLEIFNKKDSRCKRRNQLYSHGYYKLSPRENRDIIRGCSFYHNLANSSWDHEKSDISNVNSPCCLHTC